MKSLWIALILLALPGCAVTFTARYRGVPLSVEFRP